MNPVLDEIRVSCKISAHHIFSLAFVRKQNYTLPLTLLLWINKVWAAASVDM